MMFAFQIEKLIMKKIQSSSIFLLLSTTVKVFCSLSVKASAHTHEKGRRWSGTNIHKNEVESNTCTKHDTEIQEKTRKNQFRHFFLNFHACCCFLLRILNRHPSARISIGKNFFAGFFFGWGLRWKMSEICKKS